MSNTPETDALREAIDNGAAVEVEMTSLAMKLERERDEAKVAIRALAEHGESEIQRITKERDEARNKMADALQEVDLRTLDYERIKQERDEAREKAERYRLEANAMMLQRDEARMKLQ